MLCHPEPGSAVSYALRNAKSPKGRHRFSPGASGSPQRPRGNIGDICSTVSGVTYPVSTGPGFTQSTVIPSSAS